MGAIGRWIDERCRVEPDVMRHVLNRKFGDLDQFIGPDERCGCLVGSWLIESNRLRRWDKACPAENPRTLFGRAEIVGYLVAEISAAPRTDAWVIRLLKQRIRKSLGIAVTETVSPEGVHANR